MKTRFARFLFTSMLLIAGSYSLAVSATNAATAKTESGSVVADAVNNNVAPAIPKPVDTVPTTTVPTTTAPPITAPTTTAPATTAPLAGAPTSPGATVPVPNKSDLVWMLIATALVIMMSIPGLALFYGGLVRSKNMLSILMQVFMIFALIIVLWCIYGYSLAFTEGNRFIGSFDRVFLKGIWDPVKVTFATAPTFTKGVVIPEFTYVVFQATFAAITCALVIGSFAERAKFSAVLLFITLWFTFAYLPIAHMVWFWPGPDAIKDAASLATETVKGGWLWQKGTLDFAGGTVVHVNAAVAALVGAYVVGKRIGYGKELMLPHSLAMTMIGASLLWVGWFGFNAGSALEAGDLAALAFTNTLFATATAALSWVVGEWIFKGKPSMLGAASGAVAGLVAITPACGFVGPWGAFIIGLLAGLACLWGVNGLKHMLKADDSLDVFGVHGVGGALGALLTGVFAAPWLGGQGVYDYVANKTSPDYSIASQVWVQFQAIVTTIIWSGVVAFIAYKIVDMTIGLRVTESQEREGLDVTLHGESAYHM